MRVLLLILLFAGLTFAVGLGVRKGWRKTGRYRARRVAVVFGVLFYLYWVVFPVVFAIVATSGSGSPVVELQLGDGTKQVELETTDGLTLAGSYVPSRNGAAVITYPARDWTEKQSRMLADAGFGVLALDMRGYGGSEGERNAFGWGSTPDLDAATSYLRENGAKKIGGLGLSVGGEQLIEAAAGNKDIAAVVSEGAGERSYREMLIRGPAAALALPQALVLSGSIALLTGESPPPALDDLASEVSPGALFLINAVNGTGGEELNADYFAAAREPKQRWEIDRGGHTDGIDVAPVEYRKRVSGFLDRFLGTRAGD